LQELKFFTTGIGFVLPPFDTDETAAFLLKITDRENSDDDRASVKDVAERLGGMPLAVAQMAGSIVRRDITFAEILEDWENPRSHAALFRHSVANHGEHGYHHNLLSVWGLEKLEHSGGLLDVLAFLDPDGIPEDILQGDPVSTEIKGFPRTPIEYDDARQEPLRSSLVSRDRSAKTLVIHRLIQDTVRARMSDERYSAVFVSALQLISGVWPYEEEFGFIKNETYRWRQCNELYNHVLHLESLSARLTPPTKLSREHIQPPKLILEAAW
jgi:hypothetical protein